MDSIIAISIPKDSVAIFYLNLVHANVIKIGPVTPEKLQIVPRFDDCRLFANCMAFGNGLEYINFDFSRLIGNYFCTMCKKLVRFGSETPEF